MSQTLLQTEIEALSLFSADVAPAVTRVVYSQQDRAARTWLKQLCLAANLEVREDAIGNTFARWTGSQPGLAAVATGSHMDAIPHAGKFDGVVGVLGGLEAIRALQRSGFAPRRSIELILFTAEEPTRFGIGCLGSRMLSGALDAESAQKLRDNEGTSLDGLREAAGFHGALTTVQLPATAYSAFVELHIEQGAILEREGIALGVVTHIAAPASFRIHVEGEGGHAGGRLMAGRRDALCSAAEIVLAAEAAALATGSVDTVATIGICQVHPGAINSIPSRVELTLDLRDTEQSRRNRVQAEMERACAAIALRRDVAVTMETINADPPAACSAKVITALTQACADAELPYRTMVSRAYHDSLFMVRLAPAAMLFIPCRGGVSHRPDEFAEPHHIAQGVLVLAKALAALSHQA